MFAGLVVDDPAHAVRVDEAAVEHDPDQPLPGIAGEREFAALLAMAWIENPAAARVLQHAEQRRLHASRRLSAALGRYAAHGEPAFELRQAPAHIGRRIAFDAQLLQFGVDETADLPRRFPGPIEDHRGRAPLDRKRRFGAQSQRGRRRRRPAERHPPQRGAAQRRRLHCPL